MGWFGPSKDVMWRQLSEEIGAEFIEGGFWKENKVQAHVGPWMVTLDINKEGDSQATRLRAPYVNPEGFRFTIYRKGLFSELGKLLGMQDIEVGDPEFDEAFIIQGNDEFRVRDLFAEGRLRSLALVQPKLRLSVKDDEGWFGARFPGGVDELHFQVLGVIKEVDRLKALFGLFAEVLDQLCRMRSAYEEITGV